MTAVLPTVFQLHSNDLPTVFPSTPPYPLTVGGRWKPPPVGRWRAPMRTIRSTLALLHSPLAESARENLPGNASRPYPTPNVSESECER